MLLGTLLLAAGILLATFFAGAPIAVAALLAGARPGGRRKSIARRTIIWVCRSIPPGENSGPQLGLRAPVERRLERAFRHALQAGDSAVAQCAGDLDRLVHVRHVGRQPNTGLFDRVTFNGDYRQRWRPLARMA